MDHKGFAGGVQIKDAAKGEVTAVFATLGVKDSDGDVTVPGAFEPDAEVVISAYGHTSWGGALPVGKGTIREVGSEAILDAKFFLDTAAGADTFAVVKELGSLGQWSYGFAVTKWSRGEHDGEQVRFIESTKVFEVSPVLLGAGVNTRTLTAKSAAGLRFTEHAASVLAEVETLIGRAADVQAMRREKGKALAGDSHELLAKIDGALHGLADVLSQTDEHPDDDATKATSALREQLHREYARYVQLTHR